MRTFLLLAFCFSAVNGWACELQVPEKLIMSGVQTSGNWPFAHEGCTSEQVNSFQLMLNDHQGMVSIKRLQAAVGDATKIISATQQIQILRLDELVKATYPQAAESGMTLDGDSIDGDFVGLQLGSEVKVKCHPCLFNVNEALRLEVRSFGNPARDYSYTAKFNHFVLAPRAKVTVVAFSNALNNDQFEMVRVPQVSYGRYQTDLSKINYYKPNKTIRAGEFLRESDLVPLTLVRAGDKIDLFFENDQVRVKSHATSRQNGGIGDKIEVWNQANGKKYRGRITDHNKVVVEL